MKQTTIIIFLIFKAFFCIGQIIDFKEFSFDLSELNYKNEYKESSYDTIPSGEYQMLWYYQKRVHASKNHKFFIVVNSSMPVGPINVPIGSDMPPDTHYSYYNRNKLLWQGNKLSGLSNIHFFEDDGSVILRWSDPFEMQDYCLFHDQQGYVFDSISGYVQIKDLDNNLKLIQRSLLTYGADLSKENIRIINSRGHEIWNDSIILQKDISRYIDLPPNGSMFLIHSNDSTWAFDSNLNLLWKMYRDRLTSRGYFLGNGDYIARKKMEQIDINTIKNKPELYIYDSKTGDLLKRIDTLFYNDTYLTSLSPRIIHGSDYVYYENIFWDIGKCDIVFADVTGKVLFSKSYELQSRPTKIEFNNGFNLYHNDDIIEIIKYKP